jgi:luciferase family oxidoreductase group 1
MASAPTYNLQRNSYVLRLSVLDQSIAISGRTQDASIRDSIALAQHCETLGYERFWVAEHHNHDTIAGSAPEILMAAIAATTKRIRVGSAGIMLPHYSSLKVAEQFRVLEAIAPGRIDMGLGRAPGSDSRTAYALHPQAATRAEQFPAQVRDLLAWVAGEPLPDDHPFRTIRAFPSGPTVPEAWILGSSDGGAQVAAYFGLPYCFAHFITDGRGATFAFDMYRENYRPSPRHPKPQGALCVWALAAETEEEADYLFQTRAYWRLTRDSGVLRAIESPEEVMKRPLSDSDKLRIAALKESSFVGTPDKVAEQLRTLSKGLDVQEIALLTWTYDPKARQRSYELMAKEFGMTA